MMILNLINVIAIAMGIGTSVKSTNLDVEKKTRRNVITNIHETINFDKMASYYTTTPAPYEIYVNKYYLENDNNSTVYLNNGLNITNSTYSMQFIDETLTNMNKSSIYSYFAITNYNNGAIELTLKTQVNLSDYLTYYRLIRSVKTNAYLNNYINLTLTPAVVSTLEDSVATLSNNGTIMYQTNGNIESNDDWYYMDIPTTAINIQPNETIYIFFYMYIQRNQANVIDSPEPTSLTIEGTFVADDVTYEVIDVPGLMFTILTLPFSFISQAFNLTIFPNTPYQINFTNLFMTIIAIFILIWLIKHIFK